MTGLTDSRGRELPASECPSDRMLRAYGDVFFIALRSPRHHAMRLAETRMYLETPLILGQYRVFRIDDIPRGFFTWAWLDRAGEKKLVSGEPLTRADWNAGDRLWIIDLVAPYRGLAAGMVRWITVPGNFTDESFFFRRVDGRNRTRKIMSIDFDRPGLKTIWTEAEFLADC